MSILIIGSALLGAVLGRFFKVLVLVPGCAITLAVVLVRAAYVEQSVPCLALDFAVLIASLETGYASGLLSPAIPGMLRRRGKPRARESSVPATAMGPTRRQ